MTAGNPRPGYRPRATRGALHDILSHAVDEGWGISKVASEIADTFDIASGMLKVPHVGYEEQINLLLEWLKETREIKGETFSYFERINVVRGDSTGQGDFPMEFLRDHSGLPMGDESSVQFTKQAKNEMFTLYDRPSCTAFGRSRTISAIPPIIR